MDYFLHQSHHFNQAHILILISSSHSFYHFLSLSFFQKNRFIHLHRKKKRSTFLFQINAPSIIVHRPICWFFLLLYRVIVFYRIKDFYQTKMKESKVAKHFRPILIEFWPILIMFIHIFMCSLCSFYIHRHSTPMRGTCHDEKRTKKSGNSRITSSTKLQFWSFFSCWTHDRFMEIV